MLTIGRASISVGVDDPAILDVLAPWVSGDADEVIDWGVSGERSDPETNTRKLPALWWGSTTVATSHDPAQVVDWFLRTLTASAAAPDEGMLAFDVLPLHQHDRVVLAPKNLASKLSTRLLALRGVEFTYSPVVYVDAAGRARVPAPLGGSGEQLEWTVAEWWLDLADDRELTLAMSAAQAIKLVESQDLRAVPSTLERVVATMRSVPTLVVPDGRSAAAQRAAAVLADAN
jgi:hypothetical protein